MNLTKVDLTDSEYLEATQLARGRSTKSNSRKFSNHTEFKIHLMGIVAEFAFSKKVGVKAQRDISPGGDGGCDFIIGKKIIQLKTRDCKRFPHPDLLVRVDYAKADYYILSTWFELVPQTTAFIGYTDHCNLIKKRVDLGYGDRFICTRDNLGSINLMFNAITDFLGR